MSAVELSTPGGQIGGWYAEPQGKVRGGIVVVQEIFGITRHIREQVERLAEQGFAALAPALFDFLGPDIVLEYDSAGVSRGLELVKSLGFDRALQGVDAAARRLAEQAVKVGVVGYCWGGTVAFLSNTRLGYPAVSYYGGRTVPFLHELQRAPLMFHFGQHDHVIPPEYVQAHRDALPDAEVHVYDAGHGFACDQRDDYSAEAAKLAMQRTVQFFTRTLLQ